MSWGLPWHTVPCIGAYRCVPCGLPVAVGHFVQLWWGLPWRVVVLVMAVEPGYALVNAVGTAMGSAKACHQKVE